MTKISKTDTATAIRLDVRKDSYMSRWVGDLVWSDGKVWPGWQIAHTLKSLTASARATFDGPIERVPNS